MSLVQLKKKLPLCFLFGLILIHNGYISGAENIEFGFGTRGGIQQVYFDDAGSSFKIKRQDGYGFNFYGESVFYKYAGVQIELPGYYYCSNSNTSGGYYYPERVEIPWSAGIKGVLPFSSGRVFINMGYSFPYVMTFSYYFPRRVLSGLTAEIGGDIFIQDKKITLGAGLKYVYFFDNSSDRYFSLYYLLSIGYRVF